MKTHRPARGSSQRRSSTRSLQPKRNFDGRFAFRVARIPGSADPIRVIETVTAGVAFLAAGAIIQARGRVQGLTAGAAMWLAGAGGVASGAGYYSIALMATVLALIIPTALTCLERRMEAAQSPRPAQRLAVDSSIEGDRTLAGSLLAAKPPCD